MWSLGEAENTLREEIQTFRREANNEIRQISYHIASLNNIQFPEKIQASFLLSIQRYSTKPGASPYFLHHLLAEHNLFFIAVLFSMTNTTKVAEFQHRILEGLERLCNRTLQSRRVATATGHRCAFRKLSIHQPIHVSLQSIPMTKIAGPANG